MSNYSYMIFIGKVVRPFNGMTILWYDLEVEKSSWI